MKTQIFFKGNEETGKRGNKLKRKQGNKDKSSHVNS